MTAVSQVTAGRHLNSPSVTATGAGRRSGTKIFKNSDGARKLPGPTNYIHRSNEGWLQNSRYFNKQKTQNCLLRSGGQRVINQ